MPNQVDQITKTKTKTATTLQVATLVALTAFGGVAFAMMMLSGSKPTVKVTQPVAPAAQMPANNTGVNANTDTNIGTTSTAGTTGYTQRIGQLAVPGAGGWYSNICANAGNNPNSTGFTGDNQRCDDKHCEEDPSCFSNPVSSDPNGTRYTFFFQCSHKTNHQYLDGNLMIHAVDKQLSRYQIEKIVVKYPMNVGCGGSSWGWVDFELNRVNNWSTGGKCSTGLSSAINCTNNVNGQNYFEFKLNWSGTGETAHPDNYFLKFRDLSGDQGEGSAFVVIYYLRPLAEITDFHADPAIINAGDTTSLSATFSRGTGTKVSGVITSNDGLINMLITTGESIDVSPQKTTTYTLTVTGNIIFPGTPNVVTKTVTVTVNPIICKKGDANLDGEIDISDALCISNVILYQGDPATANYYYTNGCTPGAGGKQVSRCCINVATSGISGQVDVNDLLGVVNHILGRSIIEGVCY